MKILERNNVRISGSADPDAPTMIFAHGFGCAQSMWRFIAPAFEKDHRVILFDYVGSGKSDTSAYAPSRYSTLDGYAQDIIEICDELSLLNVIFVGHSVSGSIGILAANQRPELFSNLILVSPSPSFINDADYVGGFERADVDGLLDLMEHNFSGAADILAAVIIKNPDRDELGAELEEGFCPSDPDMAKLSARGTFLADTRDDVSWVAIPGFCESDPDKAKRFARTTLLADNRKDLIRVSIPTLIIQVTDDSIAPRSVGEFMHKQMSGSIISLLETTGHCPHMSNPAETLAVIRKYLSSVERKTLASSVS